MSYIIDILFVNLIRKISHFFYQKKKSLIFLVNSFIVKKKLYYLDEYVVKLVKVNH